MHALNQPGIKREFALDALREYLYRAVLLYLRDYRSDLDAYSIATLREMADDFAQDAVLNIQKKLDSFRGDARFTTWAYRFVINVAAAELRRRRYQHVSLESLPEQETAALMALVQPQGGADLAPDVAAERAEVVDLLLQVIRSELNERQRFAIVGVHFQGRSMQEVAEVLNISTNTLYKLLYDARKKLKTRLEAEHYGAGDLLAPFQE